MAHRSSWFSALCIILMMVFSACAVASDWPQLQHDPRRTGFTSDEVPPPYAVAWYYNFQPERVSRQVQAVTHRRLVFVPTMMGNLYALRAENGEVVWKAEVGSPVLHTAACADGRVLVASLDGTLQAFHADSGERAWTFEAPGRRCNFDQSPCIAEGKAFIATRQGVLYALKLQNGEVAWHKDLGLPVYQTAACADGTVYIGGEDMRMRAFDAETGDEWWRSKQLYGQSFRDYHPVVTDQYVLVRPMPVHPSREYFNSNYGKDPDERLDYVFQATWDRPWLDALQSEGIDPKAVKQHQCGELWQETFPKVKAGKMPDVLADAQKRVVEHYREHPYDQDLFVLDRKTGRQSFLPPHFHCLSLPGPVCPPALDAQGRVVIPWIYISHMWAALDLERQLVTEIMCTPRGGNGDETVNASVGGRYLYVMHCEEGNAQYTGVFDFKEKDWVGIPHVPKRWWQMSDNCQSGNNAASISDGRVYHIVFHQLAAFEHAGGNK